MKVIRLVLFVLMVGISFQPTIAGVKGKTSKPNILLINVDDLGWNNAGFMGSKYYETPNLDALAAQGMVFTNAYAAASNCAPSRACLMSGEWTPRHGIFTVEASDRGEKKAQKLIPIPTKTSIADSVYTLAEALHDAGYLTCHAGKWHISGDPTTQGFDVNIGGCHAGSPTSYFAPFKNVPLEAPEGYYLTDLIMDKVVEFFKTTTDDQPFFLNYWSYAVHTPLQAKKELIAKYKKKPAWNGHDNPNYAAMIENLDTQIGRLITALKESGKMDNTIIIFTSDNGGRFATTKQWPLRSGKGSYYEGGVREPLFVCWPGKIKPGTSSDVPVTHLDFYPTILEMTGIEKPKNKILDGESILPILTGTGELAERPLFWHFPVYLPAQMAGGDYSSCNRLFRTVPGSSIRLGDWKLIQYFENNDIELYNLKKDISERNNVAQFHHEKAKELLDMLEEWRKETNAPVPNELNPEYVGDAKN